MFENVNLSSLFDDSKKSITVFTIRDGAIVYMNESAKSFYGYESFEPLVYNFSSIDPHFHIRFSNVFDVDLNNLKTNISHYNKVGDSINVDVTYFIAKLENLNVCVSIANEHKITEDDKIEYDLSFYKLEQAINNSPLSIVITDVLGNIEYINPKFTEITGYTFSEVIGKSPNILKSGHQSEEYYQLMWESLTAGVSWEGEFLNKAKDGSLFWEYVRISPILDSNKNTIGYIGIKEDLNKIKRLEESVKEHNMSLLNIIRDIKHQQPTLIQNEKLKSIGSLAAGIAHEINNPISYVKNNIKLLHDELDDFTNLVDELIPNNRINDYNFLKSEIPDILRESLEGLDRVSDIVKTLRRFTTIDQFKEYQLVNLSEVIDDAIDICSYGKEDISFIVNKIYEFNDLYLAIPNDINQILYHLINNSIEAIERKLKQNISFDGNITLGTCKEDSNLIINIKDNGDGIKKEDIGRVYDPFFTTKPVGSGTGLGLNLVYDIVTNVYKGKIEIVSEYSKYTNVTITLPIYRRATPKDGLKLD